MAAHIDNNFSDKKLIRVGRRIGKEDPKFPGFKNILCLTASTAYGELSPYSLKDEEGRNMESLWQFQKVYEIVPKSTQRYSRYNQTIIWEWPSEIHVVQNPPDKTGHIRISGTKSYLTPAYFKWRIAGMNCKYPVRYPVGYHHRSKCIGSLTDDELIEYCQNPKKKSVKLLDYIDARKKIYYPLYIELVTKEPKFLQLKKIFKRENLLIVEIDGPHQESLEYYQEKYQVDDQWISSNTILINNKNNKILLNDPRHPYGHGYCLAMALLKY